MNPVTLLIDGQACAARHGAQFERRNPLDGAVASTAAAAQPRSRWTRCPLWTQQPRPLPAGHAPVILGVRAIAVPLACGSTVVLKGSELCPATHRLIAQALQDVGLPPGVVN